MRYFVYFTHFSYICIMEKLSIQGEKHLKILVQFLKKNKLMGDYLRCILEYRSNPKKNVSSINNILNVTPLIDIFSAFFSFATTNYPKKRKSNFSRFLFWKEKDDKWKTQCYYQEFKYY